MMVKCKVCNQELGALPFMCKRCNDKFCTKHRLPEDHECPNLEKGKFRPTEEPIRREIDLRKKGLWQRIKGKFKA